MSYFFIVNPAAGNGAERFLPVFKSLLAQNGHRCKFAVTQDRGHASELAALAIAEGFSTIVAVGGDGTIRETALSLVGKEKTLAIIPCGSGNGLARNLHIPMNPAEACAGILKWKARKIDVGMANGHPFFCTAGFGLDAEVAKIFNKRKGRRGIFPYVFHSVNTFIWFKPRRFRLKLLGGSSSPCIEGEFMPLVFTVANGREYGGGAKIAPSALLDDGLLDISVVDVVSVIRAARMLPSLFKGDLDKYPEVHIFKCSSAEVTCIDEPCFHLDGDDMESGNTVKFYVLPGQLNVIAPEPY